MKLSVVLLKQVEYGLYGDLVIIYPRPFSIYLRGKISPGKDDHKDLGFRACATSWSQEKIQGRPKPNMIRANVENLTPLHYKKSKINPFSLLWH